MKPLTALIITADIILSACQVDTSDLAQFTHVEYQNPTQHEIIEEPFRDKVITNTTQTDKKTSRDPFNPVKPIKPGEKPPVIKIQNRHNREPLEAYPLNTLHWVGTLKQNQQLWALIQTHEGTLHRIQPGAYLGENGGRLLSIEPARLSIQEVETLSDGTRHDYMKYLERKAEQ
ncbi:MAG: pilus assembly protein PilP [Methylococcaceae bacterium]